MKKFYLILLSVFALLNTTVAQELKVKSFSLDINDLTASTDVVPDKNGDPCALVKILVVDSIAKLEGFVLKTKKSSPTELWAYMSNGAKEIRIKPTHYKPLYVYFPNFGINGVEGKRTYILDLEGEKFNGVAEPVDAGGNFYAISVQPKTAMLWIDGHPQEVSSDGEYSAMLAYGSHTYKVEAGGYISKSGSFTIGKGDMTPISVSLVSAMATLNVSCLTPAVSLYVDKKSVGSLPWNGSLKEGMHLLEVRKSGYATSHQTVTVSEGQTASISGSLTSSSSSYSSNALSSNGSSSFAEITIPVKNGISIEMVKVEAGSFNMGATTEMENPDGNEKPVHRVTLTNNYYIGKYEVTQALWQVVMGSNPSGLKGDDLPVEGGSWNDCQDFISKLNSLTGKHFRLPTEAEWEYAARGGNKSRGYQYSGGNTLGDVAWYDGNSGSNTHAVGTKQPNELGIYDMTGNVWEWCQDWYGSYSGTSQTNPTGAVSGSFRVFRGGGWLNSAGNCRSSCRYCEAPGFRFSFNLGLRLVLSE